VSINVQLCANNINNNNSPSRDPDYWTRRREWWAAKARREGVDWPGVIKTQIEVADFLARLRKRGPA
jgi:hypothetical protein